MFVSQEQVEENHPLPNALEMTDRYTIHSQLEHLQSKYIGTGHADTTKWEWLVNQHRDSYCSYMGHFDLLNYFSIAENESKARVRFNLMEKMLQPCGPPSDKPDDL
ncbi:Splicing factor 3B subunit 5 [Acipenser ruthenus]|uniref:Splicing factor 3B subunit 5 n=3 Tax=Acipenseridae TaxID=7900 RepID=A0A662YSF8_ACIRT|nr:Splicing factor 3B subunit 5 [Acipenser ruthenus]